PPERHTAAGINKEVSLEVGFLLILLDEVAVGFAVGAPVDVPDLVAWRVLAMLGKLDRDAFEGTAVNAAQEGVDHLPGDQHQAAVFAQFGKVESDHAKQSGVEGFNNSTTYNLGRRLLFRSPGT